MVNIVRKPAIDTGQLLIWALILCAAASVVGIDECPQARLLIHAHSGLNCSFYCS
jgi:hypothetical protein